MPKKAREAPPAQRKKNQQKHAAPSRSRSQLQQQRKPRKENEKKSTKKKRAFMQCTRLKAIKFPGHAQPASDVDQDISWGTTMTGTLAVTVGLLVTSRNKQF